MPKSPGYTAREGETPAQRRYRRRTQKKAPPRLTRQEKREVEQVTGTAAQEITGSARGLKRAVERGPVTTVIRRAAREEEARLRRETRSVLRDYNRRRTEARLLGLPLPPPPEFPEMRALRESEAARIAADFERRYRTKPPGGIGGVLLGHPLKMEGGFLERVGRGVTNVLSVPAATLELGSAVGADVRGQLGEAGEIVRHPLRENRTRRESKSIPLLKGLGEAYVQTLKHPLRDPIATGLTFAGLRFRGRKRGPIEKAVTAKVVPLERPVPRVSGSRAGGPAPAVAPMLRPEPRISPEVKVREALGSARARAAAQKGLYREERTKRIREAEEAVEAAGGGIAGEKAARAALKGELPKVRFEHLRHGRLTEAELDDLIRTIQDSELRPFEKRRAASALDDAFFFGKTPQPSQIKLLQTVFGQDGVKAIAEAGKLARLGRLTLDVVNLPRSLMSTFDASGLLRQNLAAGARHPVIWGKNFPLYFKTMFSEKNYRAANASLKDRPNYHQYEESGLDLLDLGDELMKRDELFMSQAAERIPVAGQIVRGSGRGFNAFGNRMRADMFDEQVRLARKAGRNVEDRKLLRGIANLANNATGRGTLGPIESWAPALNGIFWSPRLAASRFNMVANPFWYARLPKGVRKEAARTMVHLGAAAASVLGVAYLFGARVGQDPRSADFAKMRIGDTRVDILGGFQQYVKLASQLGSGTVVSSTTGEPIALEGGFGGLSKRDIVQRFGEGKLNPAVSFFNDMLKGEDFEGHPFRAEKAALQRVVPLVSQDAYDLYKSTDSIPLALLGFAVAAFGIGTQTYGPKAPAKKAKQKFETWHSEAETVWRKTGQKGPLPAVLVRAYRANEALKTALAAKKEELDLERQSDIPVREQALAYVDAVIDVYPDQEAHRLQWASALDQASPEAIKARALPWFRKKLGLSFLVRYGDLRSRYKLSLER
jgi:hypothetical protein